MPPPPPAPATNNAPVVADPPRDMPPDPPGLEIEWHLPPDVVPQVRERGGRYLITLEPEIGATVRIAGVEIGGTPIELEVPSSGTQKISVSLDGY